MTAELETDRHALLFSVRMSMRYHQKRRWFFDFWQRVQNFVSILGGSAALAGLSKAAPFAAVPEWVAPASMLAVTVLGAAALVIGFGRRSWEHADLAKRFMRLEADVQAADTAEVLSACRRRRLEIEADEPPCLNVLAILCMNEVARAEYPADQVNEHLYRVNFLQRALAQYFDLGEARIRLN